MHPLSDVRQIIAGFEDPRVFLAGLFENSPVSMQVFDKDGRCRLVNRAFEQLFHSVPPPDYNIFEDDIAEKTGIAGLIRRAYAGEVVTTPPVWYDPRQLTNVKVSEGRRVAIVVTFFPLRDAAGKVTDVVLIHQDVTALKTQQESLATTLRSIGDAVIATDTSGCITTMNPVAEQLTGWPQAEALGKPLGEVFRIISEEDGKPVASPVDKVLREGVIVGMANHTALVRRDGELLPIADSAAPIKGEDGRLSGVVMVFRDATAERKAADELRNSEERLRALLDNCPVVMWSVNASGVFQTMAGAALKQLGLNPENLIGRSFFDLFADMVDAGHLRRALKGEAQSYQTTFAARNFDVRMSPIIDEHGKIVGATAVNVDVTDRTHGEERFRLLIESLPAAILLVDGGGTVRLINRQAEDMFGYRRDELVGRHVTAVIPERFHKSHPLLPTRKLTAPVTHLAGAEREQFALRKGGKEFAIEVGLTPVDAKDGWHVLATVVDISDRRQLEAEQKALQSRIQHAQKLESLGVLAGGIAHDFNNLLMAIMGNADLALMRMPPESSARANVEQIEVATRRAADLTRQMLAYSGRGKVQLASINLSASVQEMAHLLQVSVSKRAVLKYHFASNLPTIEADPGQITQVVMNLITNASEAIGEKSGLITISTGVMEADREYLLGCICDEGLPEGVYVYVEVSDTGVGMSAETKARIFEPFFTTKFTGRGLGLSAVQGIVRGHKGALRVYSELGRGTTIKIMFPAGSRPTATETRETDTDRFRGQGTILVVDDEESIRTVAKMILEEFGFSVMTAEDGLKAVQTFRDAGDRVAAVLLDMTMPHMDGEECFRELRRIRPDVKVILSSGYSEQDATVQFAGKGLAGFLQKPYRPVQLVDMLKRALGQP